MIAVASDATNAEVLMDVSPALLARMFKGGVWVVYDAE